MGVVFAFFLLILCLFFQREHLTHLALVSTLRFGSRESHSAQSVAKQNWWADSIEWYIYVRNIQNLLFDGKTTYERVLENHLNDQ